MRQTVQQGNGQAYLSPSRKVRKVLGAKLVAELCNRTTEAIRKWDRDRSKGGTGGLVPSEFQARLLAYAQEHGLPLSPADLIAEPVFLTEAPEAKPADEDWTEGGRFLDAGDAS